MTTRHSCSLIAALTYLAVLAFPGSATAQSYQWTGVATFSDYEVDATTGQVLVDDGGTGSATLSIDLDGVAPGFAFGDINLVPLPWDAEYYGEFNGTFGPGSVSGSYEEGIGDAGFAYGSFSSDLQTYAVANFYVSVYDFGSNSYITESASFETLQAVPEPSTLTLAGIGVLAVGIFMKSRRPLRSSQTKAGADQKS
jgi:PEP-CTERM motif